MDLNHPALIQSGHGSARDQVAQPGSDAAIDHRRDPTVPGQPVQGKRILCHEADVAEVLARVDHRLQRPEPHRAGKRPEHNVERSNRLGDRLGIG